MQKLGLILRAVEMLGGSVYSPLCLQQSSRGGKEGGWEGRALGYGSVGQGCSGREQSFPGKARPAKIQSSGDTAPLWAPAGLTFSAGFLPTKGLIQGLTGCSALIHLVHLLPQVLHPESRDPDSQ